MLDWGREVCSDVEAAERRESLCTNGLGAAWATDPAYRGRAGLPIASVSDNLSGLTAMVF